MDSLGNLAGDWGVFVGLKLPARLGHPSLKDFIRRRTVGSQRLLGVWTRLLKQRGFQVGSIGDGLIASTLQLPFQTHQIPSDRDQKALNKGTLGGLIEIDKIRGRTLAIRSLPAYRAAVAVEAPQ